MRRFLIGTVAAAALFASAAPPAQAHHDKVCGPEPVSYLCVEGHEHVLPNSQATAWEEFLKVWNPLAAAFRENGAQLEDVPDSVCVDTDPNLFDEHEAPLCVTGIRGVAKTYYSGVFHWTLGWPYYGVCTALQRPGCAIPPY